MLHRVGRNGKWSLVLERIESRSQRRGGSQPPPPNNSHHQQCPHHPPPGKGPLALRRISCCHARAKKARQGKAACMHNAKAHTIHRTIKVILHRTAWVLTNTETIHHTHHPSHAKQQCACMLFCVLSIFEKGGRQRGEKRREGWWW